MNPELFLNWQRVTRRQLFGSAAYGIGATALASLMKPGPGHAAVPAQPASTDPGKGGQPGLPNLPHFAPRASRFL